MKVYLVGGAVRDSLLNLPIKEKDWVVIGSTEEEMLSKGFSKVGKDFPVFLHPETKEEYALARKERKTDKGYHGFVCDFSPNITLEDDLIRRDLTINAIAKDEDGNILDPYNGLSDIKNKTLRHISDAFVEDPLRVLRVARFAARFHHLGFKVADETINLMKKITENGELEKLSPERVWTEITKSLVTKNPRIFFETLRESNSLKVILPELDILWGVPQREEYHPEIDTGIHIMMVLDEICKITKRPEIRCAALFHDLGKGLTPKEEWPSHKLHEIRGVKVIEQVSERLKMPNYYTKLATKCSKNHLLMHTIFELRPKTLLRLLYDLEAFNNDKYLEPFVMVCESDQKGRKGMQDNDYPQANFLKEVFLAAKTITTEEIIKQGFKGKEIGSELDKKRIMAIKALKNDN